MFNKSDFSKACLLALLIGAMFSCNKDKEVPPKETNPNNPVVTDATAPVISSFYPAEGSEGTYMAIAGKNFSETINYNLVSFPKQGGGKVTVEISFMSRNSDSVWVVVPAGVASGPISVAVQQKTTVSQTPFTVVEPRPGLKMSSRKSNNGKVIGLYGIPFIDPAGLNYVTFKAGSGDKAGYKGDVMKVDVPKQILWVIVPTYAVSGKVVATLNGVTYSSAEPLEIVPCNVSTVAGNIDGYLDATGTTAKFDHVGGMTIGADGMVYMCDSNNEAIRKYNPLTREVTTLAGGSGYGFADGVGTAAKFYSPTGITTGKDGMLYVADYYNHRIRKIDPTTRQVTTVAGSATRGSADGTGASATFNLPHGLTTAPDGAIYITEYESNRIRKFNPATGQVTTVAGNGTSGTQNGTAASATFNRPAGIIADGDSVLYVADWLNNLIRKVDLRTNQVSTYAGGGSYSAVYGTKEQIAFGAPRGLALDAASRTLVITENESTRVRSIDMASGLVTTLSGGIYWGHTDGACPDAKFENVSAIVQLPDRSFLISDMQHGLNNDLTYIRRIQY
jgi:sugar lactone lactonase YvrE